MRGTSKAGGSGGPQDRSEGHGSGSYPHFLCVVPPRQVGWKPRVTTAMRGTGNAAASPRTRWPSTSTAQWRSPGTRMVCPPLWGVGGCSLDPPGGDWGVGLSAASDSVSLMPGRDRRLAGQERAHLYRPQCLCHAGECRAVPSPNAPRAAATFADTPDPRGAFQPQVSPAHPRSSCISVLLSYCPPQRRPHPSAWSCIPSPCPTPDLAASVLLGCWHSQLQHRPGFLALTPPRSQLHLCPRQEPCADPLTKLLITFSPSSTRGGSPTPCACSATPG